MKEADRILEIARTVWRSDARRPSAEVMDKIEGCARKGFTWCTVPLEALEAPDLHWLSIEGFVLAKLPPQPYPGRVGCWRINWGKVPVGMDSNTN